MPVTWHFSKDSCDSHSGMIKATVSSNYLSRVVYLIHQALQYTAMRVSVRVSGCNITISGGKYLYDFVTGI